MGRMPISIRPFKALLILVLVCFSQVAFAAIHLPLNLNKGDREEALRIVGFGTSSKLLSDPYPLGGYQGFEVGVSVETVPTEDLGRLGSRLTTPQQDVSFPKLTIGKGLYNDLDFFVQFTPYNHQDELTQYGAIVRWSFYQAKSLPISASVLAHANTGNINNLMTTKSYGFDVITGINVKNVALFAGIGPIEASGTFVGGKDANSVPSGITASNLIENEFVSGLHTVVGVNVHISQVFFAAQLDRYSVQVFSGKLGVRF
jgi:hypothetical protein